MACDSCQWHAVTQLQLWQWCHHSMQTNQSIYNKNNNDRHVTNLLWAHWTYKWGGGGGYKKTNLPPPQTNLWQQVTLTDGIIIHINHHIMSKSLWQWMKLAVTWHCYKHQSLHAIFNHCMSDGLGQLVKLAVTRCNHYTVYHSLYHDKWSMTASEVSCDLALL